MKWLLTLLVAVFLVSCTSDPVACTMDARICPDGSAVGRVGPDCEFAPCPEANGQVVCTEEAKLCSDGSYVARVPPDCEFVPCPDEGQNEEQHACTPEEKQAEFCIEIYDPVCGWFNEKIQCIRYPCATMYSNSCFACMAEEVAYWTEGECPIA